MTSKKALATTGKKSPPAKRSAWDLDGMTEEQADEAMGIKERVKGRKLRPSVSMEGEGRVVKLGGGKSDAEQTLHSMRLYEASGSASNEFVSDLTMRIANAVRRTGNDAQDADRISAALALVASIEPRSEVEATMALQMVAANEAALLCYERMRNVQFMEQATAYSNMANKSARTFSLHWETICKIRRGGEQVVRHVHVSDGGQAVIANTVNTGRGA